MFVKRPIRPEMQKLFTLFIFSTLNPSLIVKSPASATRHQTDGLIIKSKEISNMATFSTKPLQNHYCGFFIFDNF